MDLATRAALITSTAEATGVNIATWFLATVFIVMYLSRQVVKFVMLRKLQLDDYVMTIAVLFAVGLSFAYSIAADNGLGNESVSLGAFHKIQKAYYAADLLYVIATYCVKLSVVIYFYNLAVDELQKRVIAGLGVVCVASAVCNLLAAAFQCGASKAWEVMTPHCFSQAGFWVTFGIIDMLTDIALVFVSIMLVWNIRIPISRKVVVVGCFAPRMLVVAATASRLAYLVPAYSDNNPAFKIWIAVICTELQICLSISTACIASIKPFFEGIEAGVWQADQLRRQGLSIDDLFSKGYAKPNLTPEVSKGSDCMNLADIENKSSTVGGSNSKSQTASSVSLKVLPAFVGGEWRDNA